MFGTARFLVEAKQAGLLGSVNDALHEMKENNYWIDEKICRWARRLAGEGVQPIIRAVKGQNIPAQSNALGTGNVEN